MGEDQFEWDDAKAQSNLVKHGVSFEAGSRVFGDVFAFDQLDLESQPGENQVHHHRYGQRRSADGGLHRTRGTHPDHLSEKGDEA